jgi:hypothetical protein
LDPTHLLVWSLQIVVPDIDGGGKIMSQENTSAQKPSTPHPDTPQAESNTPDVDFKPYLEAATISSDRTRATIYVLVIAVVIIFTAYRQTIYPGWIDARLLKLQTAAACLKAKIENTPQCVPAVKYSKDFLYVERGTELLFKHRFESDLKEQISILLKLRTEALSLRLPFFGVAMDVNDLGVIGGIFLASILYILNAWLYREVDNVNRAMKKVATLTGNEKKEHLEHLLMTQVLASRKGITLGVFFLLAGVLVVHGFVLRSDITTRSTAGALQGEGWALFETVLDGFFYIVVVILSLLCGYRQRKLDKSVDNLIAQVDGRTSAWKPVVNKISQRLNRNKEQPAEAA